MEKLKVLFVSDSNSARSLMAGALLDRYSGYKFEAESAGIEPGTLNPIAIKTMAEIGIDITKKSISSVFELLKSGKLFNYIFTFSDENLNKKYPVFPSSVRRVNLFFPDPVKFSGTEEQKLKLAREMRHGIKIEMLKWAAVMNGSKPAN